MNKNESKSNAGSVKKQGRRIAQTYGRTAKPDAKRRANKGTRHKQWQEGT